MNFAAAMVLKDNSIPKLYIQIKYHPQAETWYQAGDKVLNKLIDIGKMELVKKSDTSEQDIIPIMEEYSKKTYIISKQQIFKCQFVADAARLKLMHMLIFVVASENIK
eukprot:snap_masked-scaffold_17-processed-gene-1.11-mRNA-1 protein AED:1.00 eAED:1.00 QI:0/0/0/0/1/1/2/0/107